MARQYIGSDFDDMLAEDGIREEVTAKAIKRVIAWQLSAVMQKKKISKTEMAARMSTSRAMVNRLLDEDDTSVTLVTLARASVAVGSSLKVEFGLR
jgi:antitoxin HicB